MKGLGICVEMIGFLGVVILNIFDAVATASHEYQPLL